MGELHQQSDLGKYGWTLRVQNILTIYLNDSSFCLFVLLRIRVSSFRELLWQMLQEQRALSCWAARDLDSPQVPAADFTASQLCSQSATRASLREALVCVEC